MTPHPWLGDPAVREVSVPVATVWSSPDAPRGVDAAAVGDRPDPAAWVAELDADGTADRRLGLHGRTLTQLLLGEPVRVLEETPSWARVVAPWQGSSGDERGYPGWVRRAHLAAPVDRVTGPTVRVPGPATTLTTGTGEVAISCGTWLWAEEGALTSDRVRVLLPGGGRGSLSRHEVRTGSKSEPVRPEAASLLATARQLLGVRYLWGGTSRWGLDCSGLVHLVLRSHGVLVPRDAADQAAAPGVEPVPLDDVRPGDLYFFARPGAPVHHVGFATSPVAADGARWMLHAPEGGVALTEEVPMPRPRRALLVGAGRVRR